MVWQGQRAGAPGPVAGTVTAVPPGTRAEGGWSDLGGAGAASAAPPALNPGKSDQSGELCWFPKETVSISEG